MEQNTEDQYISIFLEFKDMQEHYKTILEDITNAKASGRKVLLTDRFKSMFNVAKAISESYKSKKDYLLTGVSSLKDEISEYRRHAPDELLGELNNEIEGLEKFCEETLQRFS